MAIWKRKNDYVDLSSQMRKRQAQIESFGSNSSETPIETVSSPTSSSSSTSGSSGNGFFGGFFGGGQSSTPSEPAVSNSDISSDERRKKLARRLMDMTSKIEDMENTIYKMNQRIEVLERKNRLDY